MNEPAYVSAALALRESQPRLPARDVVSWALQGHGVGDVDPAAPWLSPRSPFRALLAEAFDCGMTPDEWHALTGPEAHKVMRDALGGIWPAEVLGASVEFYSRT